MAGVDAAPLLAEATGALTGTALVLALQRFSAARARIAVRVLAAVAATGTAAAGPSPTGLPAADTLLSAALGASVVLLGSRAPSTSLLLAAVGGVVGTIGSGVQVLALATAGLLVAAAIGRRSSPVIRSIACCGLAQVVTRMTYPRTTGGTALLAGALLLPVFIGGAKRLSPRSRRRLARAMTGGTLFAAGAGLVAAAAAVAARPSLERGLAAARAAVIAVGDGDQDQASSSLEQASVAFAGAARIVDRWWSYPAAVVPVVGQHWQALRAAASTGRDVSSTGTAALSALDAVQNIRIAEGRVPLEEIGAVTPKVVRTAQVLTHAERRLSAARSPWLLPQVASPLTEHAQRVTSAGNSARSARDVLLHLPALLGGEGPRRYFLAVQTPSELRASGGYMGNWGEITADGGTLTLARFGRTDDLNSATDPRSRTLVAPADYVARYGRYRPEWRWGNVGASPDFPTVAGVIASLYPQSGGAPIDGTIAIDPYGLAAILRLTGPLTVEAWPEPLTADNVADVLLHHHYVRFAGQERIDFLGEVTQRLWERLTATELPGPREVLQALGPAVTQKRVQLSSSRPAEQRLFQRLGVAGRMAPVEGDFLGVITQNGGTNKLDWFLRRAVDYEAHVNPSSGHIQSRVQVVLHNEGPPEPIPGGVNDTYATPPVPLGAHALHLSVYTPWRLQQAVVDGRPVAFEGGEELGRRVYSTFLVIPAQSSVTVELRFTGRLQRPSGYRLDLHRQPTVAPDDVRASVTLNGRSLTWEGPLFSDKTLRP